MKSWTALPTIVRSTRPDGLLRVNQSFVDRLGLTGESIGGRPLLDWIHPDDRDALATRIDAGDGGARARHRTTGGDWVAFDWRVKVHDDDVVSIGLLHVGASESSTVRPPAECPTRGLMSETLNAMALAVESRNPGMRCSILLVDADGEHIAGGAGPSLPDAYNQAVEGLRIGPGVGSCGTAAFWNVPVIVENIAEDPLWENLRDAAAIAGVASCWSFPVTRTDGSVLGAMALYDVEPSAPEQHQFDGLEVAARMVGLAIEHDRLEEQLRQATKMEAIGVLAGGIAHDFNNLLTTIRGNAELAMMTMPREADNTRMLQEVVAATDTAAALCSQMLVYAGRGARSVETIECNALVRELGSLLRVTLSKKATLRYELHGEALGVLADRSQMEQVIMNLITNASEAIGNTEGSIALGTDAATYTRGELEQSHPDADLQPGEYVQLWVTDSGSGMRDSAKDRVFDPFFTTKSDGRGLGLAAVQGIIRGHGGAIALESTSGVGTTFSILLPRAPLARDESADAEPPVHDPANATVLVVDDEPSVRNTLIGILERGGYDVIGAGDGQEAIDVFRAKSDSVDCVLLDYSMPKLDGEEVFRELRSHRIDVPVILSSGFTEQEMMDRFEGAGLAGFVKKPTSMDVILDKVAEALGRS